MTVDKEQIIQALRAAYQQYQQGDYNASEPIFRQALDYIGEDPTCLMALATIYASRGQISAAITMNRRLLQTATQAKASPEQVAGVMEQIAALYDKLGNEAESREFRGLAALERSGQGGSVQDFTTHDVGKILQNQASRTPANPALNQPPPGLSGSGAPPAGPGAQNYQSLSGNYGAGSDTMAEGGDEEQTPTPRKSRINFTRTDADMNQLKSSRLRAESAEPKEPVVDLGSLEYLSLRFGALLAKITGADAKDLSATPHVYVEDKPANPLVVFGALAAVSWVALMVISALPSKVPVTTAYESIPHQYTSADGLRLMSLPTLAQAELSAGNSGTKLGTRYFLGNPKDSLDAAFSKLFQKQYWIDYGTNGDTVTDRFGNKMYRSNGPATVLNEQMEAVDKAAETYFLKNKEYPGDIEDLNKEELSYRNPYTKKTTTPTFQAIKINDEKDGRKADQDRSDTEYNLDHGIAWEKEPPPAPGEVHSAAITIITPRGPIEQFAIHAYDGDGKLLAGSEPRSSHYILLEDGKRKSVFDPKLPFPESNIVRPTITWIALIPPNALEGFFIDFGAASLLSFASFCCAIYWVTARPKGIDVWIYAIPTALLGIAGLLYASARFLP
jgi:tetratricopeptide (TPR) repeat protein